MIAKLPRWVWFGSFVLAFVAGVVNVVGFLSVEQTPISHVTGSVSNLASALVTIDPSAGRFGLLILSFLSGAILSGFIVQDSTLRLGRRYGVVLFLAATLLFGTTMLLLQHNALGLYLGAGACGLLNAMVTTFTGAVVRTTHVTGLLTDIGVLLGHLIRGMTIDWRRLALLSMLVLGYLTGGIGGTIAFLRFDVATLYMPAGLTLLLGLTYQFYILPRTTLPPADAERMTEPPRDTPSEEAREDAMSTASQPSR